MSIPEPNFLSYDTLPTGFVYFSKDKTTGEIKPTSKSISDATTELYLKKLKEYKQSLIPFGIRPFINGKIPFFVIDVDDHEKTEESKSKADATISEIKNLLDLNNIQYSMETNCYHLGCKFWIILEKPVDITDVSEKLKIICNYKVEKKANFEFYPKLKTDTPNFPVRYPGLYKDRSGYSIDVKTGESIDTYDKVISFFEKAVNDCPITIINVLYEKYKHFIVESDKEINDKTSISKDGTSNLVGCMQTILVRFKEMITTNDVFKRSTKPQVYDFCVKELIDYIKHPTRYFFFTIAKIDFAESLVNHLLSIKEDTKEGVNAWVKIEHYEEMPSLIKSISFFRNYDGGQNPIIFYESPSFFSFADFVERLPTIKQCAILYKNTFAEQRFTKEGFVPLIKTTYRFRADGSLDFSDKLLIAYTTATEAYFWQMFSQFLYVNFCCKYEIRRPAWYVVRDMVVPTLRITNLKMVHIFDDIFSQEYQSIETYVDNIAKMIPLDIPKFEDTLLAANLKKTPIAITKDVILEVAYRAASMAYNYLPREEDVVGEDLSKINFLKHIALPNSHSPKPAVSVVLTLIGEIASGKSTITEAFALGALRSLFLDDLSNAFFERLVNLNPIKGTPSFSEDMKAMLSYCPATVFDDANLTPACADLLCGYITATSCTDRFPWTKEILSLRPLSLFLGASCDFERFLSYKAGNIRRFLVLYVSRTAGFDAISAKEYIAENFCMLIRALIKQSIQNNKCMFPKLFDVNTENFKYLEIAVDSSSKEPHWLSTMESYVVKDGCYNKTMADKYPLIRSSFDRKLPYEIYSNCAYMWAEGTNIETVIDQIYQWLFKRSSGSNISITVVKKFEEILKRNNIGKIAITSKELQQTTGKKTTSAYRFLVRTPELFKEEKNDDGDSISS